MPTEREEWRAVSGQAAGFPYEVSSIGRIRNVLTGRILSPCPNGRGYLSLGLSRYKRRLQCRLHVLVAEAFHGLRPEGLEINHKDGDKRNNAPANLEYVTHQENLRHALRIGLRGMPPEFNELCQQRRKLDLTGVARVRELFAKGKTERQVAAEMGLSKTTVARIKRGRTYAEVA